MKSEQYDIKKVDELKAKYPSATKITIVTRGDGLPKCGHTEIVYVKATGGKWGKSAETRIGLGLVDISGLPAALCKKITKRGWRGW